MQASQARVATGSPSRVILLSWLDVVRALERARHLAAQRGELIRGECGWVTTVQFAPEGASEVRQTLALRSMARADR